MEKWPQISVSNKRKGDKIEVTAETEYKCGKQLSASDKAYPDDVKDAKDAAIRFLEYKIKVHKFSCKKCYKST